MKKQLLVLSLLLSTTTFSTLSFGEWKFVSESQGILHHIDFDKIKTNVSGNISVWTMHSYSEQTDDRVLSFKTESEVDCGLFRFRTFILNFFDQRMASGNILRSANSDDPDWQYPSRDSAAEKSLTIACDYVNNN